MDVSWNYNFDDVNFSSLIVNDFRLDIIEDTLDKLSIDFERKDITLNYGIESLLLMIHTKNNNYFTCQAEINPYSTKSPENLINYINFCYLDKIVGDLMNDLMEFANVGHILHIYPVRIPICLGVNRKFMKIGLRINDNKCIITADVEKDIFNVKGEELNYNELLIYFVKTLIKNI